jgi:hypothetical protein
VGGAAGLVSGSESLLGGVKQGAEFGPDEAAGDGTAVQAAGDQAVNTGGVTSRR